MNYCLQDVQEWMSSSMLILNPDKMEFFVVRSHTRLKKLDSHLPVRRVCSFIEQLQRTLVSWVWCKCILCWSCPQYLLDCLLVLVLFWIFKLHIFYHQVPPNMFELLDLAPSIAPFYIYIKFSYMLMYAFLIELNYVTLMYINFHNLTWYHLNSHSENWCMINHLRKWMY